MIQQFKTKSGKGNIQYQLIILAAFTFVASFCLANPAGATNFAPKKTSIQSVTTEPNLMAESDWRRFASSQGNFSMSFPGKPTEEKKNDAYLVTVEGEEGLYLLSYTDIPQAGKLSSSQISKILEFAPGALMSELDGKLLSSKSISLNGYPGQ